jgi:DNA-binding IclR family transcriptional regulator
MEDKKSRGIQSIEIGGRLLTALVEEGAPMSLGELAKKAHMPSAKAHPYLVSFGSFGLVEQNPLTGRYELGPFALQLGLISLQLLDPVRIAIPVITQLAADIDQTIGLSVLGNRGPTIIYISESSYPIHVNMRTGTVMSIQATATGRVFAAFLPPKQVERMVEQERRSGVAASGVWRASRAIPSQVSMRSVRRYLSTAALSNSASPRSAQQVASMSAGSMTTSEKLVNVQSRYPIGSGIER